MEEYNMYNDYVITSSGSFVSANELYHWGLKKGEQKKDHKYIDREWKNGRWVYYYEDKKGNRKDLTTVNKIVEATGSNAKKRYQDADYDNPNSNYQKSRREYQDAYNDVSNYHYVQDPKSGKLVAVYDEPSRRQKKRFKKAEEEWSTQKYSHDKVVSQYEGTLVEKVDKGRKKVKDLVNKLGAKIEQAAKDAGQYISNKARSTYNNFKKSCKSLIDKGRQKISNWFKQTFVKHSLDDAWMNVLTVGQINTICVDNRNHMYA